MNSDFKEQYLRRCQERFTLAQNIVIELDKNLTVDSEEFKQAVIFVLMNWSKSYFDLRKILPDNYSYKFIRTQMRVFQKKAIKYGYLNELVDESPFQDMVSLGFFLNVLWIDGTIQRIKAKDNDHTWQLAKD